MISSLESVNNKPVEEAFAAKNRRLIFLSKINQFLGLFVQLEFSATRHLAGDSEINVERLLTRKGAGFCNLCSDYGLAFKKFTQPSSIAGRKDRR